MSLKARQSRLIAFTARRQQMAAASRQYAGTVQGSLVFSPFQARRAGNQQATADDGEMLEVVRSALLLMPSPTADHGGGPGEGSDMS